MKRIISCVLVCVLMLCAVANFSTARAAEPFDSMTQEEIYDYLRNHGPVEAPIDPEALLYHIHVSMVCDGGVV